LLSGRQVGQQCGNEIQANVFDLLAELVMKIVGLEDDVLAEECLLHATLIRTHSGRGKLTDVQRLDGGRVVLFEETIERIVLIGELGFADRLAEIEENARAAENAAARRSK